MWVCAIYVAGNLVFVNSYPDQRTCDDTCLAESSRLRAPPTYCRPNQTYRPRGRQ